MAMYKPYEPEVPCSYVKGRNVICNSPKAHGKECSNCGWNPAVAERRKARARIERGKSAS